ncbi:MAG: hypothetical protein PF638_11225 [Candidatus Delongbacteria bacterium]|jgi:hypothetical protein|nr:hypothetical protein [Candidatus Delongbacteria bacterium]
MAPRRLDKAPGYELNVKERVSIGQVERTKELDKTPAPDTTLAEGFSLLGGLAKIGYSIGDFFNQNNQRNSDKDWNEIASYVQEDVNVVSTKDIDKLPELGREITQKYIDKINASDRNQRTKDKTISRLNEYMNSQMESNFGVALSEDKIANITNLDARVLEFVKDENKTGAIQAISDAAYSEDAWLDKETADIKMDKVSSDVYYETAKNDLATMDYQSAYGVITDQTVAEDGTAYYTNYPDLSTDERTSMEQSIVQMGTLEAQNKQKLETEALNTAINDLSSGKISISDFNKTDSYGLDPMAKIQATQTFHADQQSERVRLNYSSQEALVQAINTGRITTSDQVRNYYDPNLEETTRMSYMDYLDGKIPKPSTKDPRTIGLQNSTDRLSLFMTQAGEGKDIFSIARAALNLSGDIDKTTGIQKLTGQDLNKLQSFLYDKAALGQLSDIMKGAEKDDRFYSDPHDSEKKALKQGLLDQFKREYVELFYNQLNEKDPEKQMDTNQFRQMSNDLIESITNKELQKEFDNAARLNKNVGIGWGSSWASNSMEDAITSLNEGEYNAMKYINEEGWTLFQRKMQKQYELIKDEPYLGKIRMYKDNLPVFTNAKGEEEMIVIVGKIPQVVPLEKGLETYKNLALGYSVGDRNASNETMLTSGWYNINNDTVDVLGSAYGGEVIRPKGKEEMYIVYENNNVMDLRPFHGNPDDKNEIAAAVKEIKDPTPPIKDTSMQDSVRDSILKATPNPFPGYMPSSAVPPVNTSEADEARQRAQDALRERGFGGYSQ